ncbi:MAG: glycoside hydrolase family 5 protein [Candidatus Marinimicrobia bacterium]|nr:glycoside hydrolase family 5 protein [Candidatus Neomarinimicrobiota bacterium]
MKYRLVLLPLSVVFMLSFYGCEEPLISNKSVSSALEIDPFIQNNKLTRSINLGNILEAPEEGAWGLSLQAEYFPIIADAGFTGIRLPVRWSAHADTIAPFTIDPVFLARVDWAIDQAFEQHLAIVVNTHHYLEMMNAPAEHIQRLLSIWGQLATHFADRSDNLILELFNEPNDAFNSDLWNTYLVQIIDTIRVIDSSRTLMVGTAPWGGIDGLDNLQLPADSNLIVTVHYYNPFQFTHQGADWVTGSDGWLGTTWGSLETDFTDLQNDFQRIKSWSTEHHRPINMGEFGAYSRAELTSRVIWTRSIVTLSEDLGFSWSYWEFAAGFGAYDPGKGEWNDILSALIQN